MADLERPKIKVGFIPIIDCAPIVLAEELGAYERQGLEVEIRREVSWANVRDKLALGVLDASHILAPLPLALTLGIDSVNVPVINAMTLQVNGNALTLSKGLWREMEEAAPELVGNGHAPLDARALAAVVAKRGRRARQAASCWPRCFPTRCRTTCCGSGCRRPVSIPTATCASPSCRRRTPSPISRAA